MENLIWLVIIGGLFYFMMRKGGCCGGGHSHGKSKTNTSKPPSVNGKAEDEKHSDCH